MIVFGRQLLTFGQGRNGTGVAAPTGANATRPTGTTTGAPVKASTAGAPALVAQAGIAGLGVAFAAFL